MIKFFRTIRQNLLNEGKTTKYLKYAIGEIVLVMIGILLALQVNNWNDERKAKIEIEAKRQSNLQEIYHDLNKDLTTIDNIVNQLKRQKEASVYVLNIVENKDKYRIDSLKFFQNAVIATGSIALERTKNAWDNLNTSGQLLTLKDESLNSRLFDYYNYYDSRIKHFNEMPQEVRQQFRNKFGPCYDLEEVVRVQKGGFKSIHPNSNWFSCFLNFDGINDDLINIFISSSFNVDWFTNLKSQAQYIIKYLEENHLKNITLNKTL